jgi:hypothetical protein
MGSESSFQQQNFTDDQKECVRGRNLGFGVKGRTEIRFSSFGYRAKRIRVICHLCVVVTSVIMESESSFHHPNLTVDLEGNVRGQNFGFRVKGRTGTRVSSVFGRNFRNNKIRESLPAAKLHC